MSRRVSLNYRRALGDPVSDEVQCVLILITHEDLDFDVRLCSDPAERISIEPLVYGTRSSWLNPNGEPWLYAIMSAVIPDDRAEAPPAAEIVLANVDSRIIEALRSTTTPARFDIAVVLASAPDLVEFEALDFSLASVPYDAAEITLSISRESEEGEYWPAQRMTRDRLPGLFK
ncbi:MAG: hypothetical protein J0J10_23110 [Bosea sp.]|uniref:hypothetical protein n=1 Tax=Bosea sp. (in: a-proteobacteria) TaxID=1871050 RepID=UPI001ACB7EB8|nr:hypothetical protein [Bosea sp. (in: a-proteobacteria)]MBN9471662.1 hypothetical protein [Bosea sp. (in: a-proteobacteria)]